MDRDQIHAAIAQERRNIADLIDSLDDSQLATESLCTGWDVKTVGSHLVSGLADGTTRAILLSWRRMNQGKAVDEMARRRVHWPAAKIAASLRDLADRQYWRPPRNHLACWPKSCVIAATSEFRLDFPSNPIHN